MGNIQGGGAFPYVIGKDVIASAGVWKLNDGTKKDDGSPVSIFSIQKQETSPRQQDFARASIKRLRTVLHPRVLKFIDGGELDAIIFMVTERVTPLQQALPLQSDNISWGLYQLSEAIAFCNNDVKLIHGGISHSTVFLNSHGDWKLGGFELATDIITASAAAFQNNDMPKCAVFNAPEISRGRRGGSGAVDLSKLPPWTVDSYALGALIYYVLVGSLETAEQLEDTRKIPKDVLPQFRALVSSNPSSRLNPAELKHSPFIANNRFVQTMLRLETLSIHDPEQNQKFFADLPPMMDSFSREACCQQILPHVVNALEFSGLTAQVLQPLFKIASMLSPERYKSDVLPVVIRLFASTDRAVRILLLRNLEGLMAVMDPPLINDKIYPSIENGFLDSSPLLRELTVKAMVYLAPKLKERTISSQVLRHLAKMQSDPEPAIRTNTTICLGMIAPHISEAIREKVLIPAFARCLRDPFGMARAAALQSLAATYEMFSNESIATKLLPNVVPLTIDPELDVRNRCFHCVGCMLSKLKMASDQQVPPPPPADGQQPAGPVSTPSSSDVSTKPSEGGMLSWAVGSLKTGLMGAAASTSTVREAPKKVANAPTSGPLKSVTKPSGLGAPVGSLPASQVNRPVVTSPPVPSVASASASVVSEESNPWEDFNDDFDDKQSQAASSDWNWQDDFHDTVSPRASPPPTNMVAPAPNKHVHQTAADNGSTIGRTASLKNVVSSSTTALSSPKPLNNASTFSSAAGGLKLSKAGSGSLASSSTVATAKPVGLGAVKVDSAWNDDWDNGWDAPSSTPSSVSPVIPKPTVSTPVAVTSSSSASSLSRSLSSKTNISSSSSSSSSSSCSSSSSSSSSLHKFSSPVAPITPAGGVAKGPLVLGSAKQSSSSSSATSLASSKPLSLKPAANSSSSSSTKKTSDWEDFGDQW